MQKIQELWNHAGVDFEVDAKRGPQTLHLVVYNKEQAKVLHLKYEAAVGETVQALMMRAAQDVTAGDIMDIRLSRESVLITQVKEEQQALIEQTIAVL